MQYDILKAYSIKTITFKNNKSLTRSFYWHWSLNHYVFFHVTSLIIEWFDIFSPNIPELFTNSNCFAPSI